MALERWFTMIEFTFNVETEPSKPRHPGDELIDFARRAFEEGLYPRLSQAFPGNDGINWHLIGENIDGINYYAAKRES